MVTLQLYDFTKNEKKTVDASPELFNVDVKPEVMHQVVEAHLAGLRAGTASTKTRAEVAGGGRKPWKQKGTGRARAGTNTSPLWKGGGVAFGPSPRDYTKKVNKKVKRLALRMALTAKKDATLVLKGFEVAQPKTKEAVALMSKADIKNSLIIMGSVSETLLRATNNIENIKIIRSNEMTVYELLKYENICIDSEALTMIEKELLK